MESQASDPTTENEHGGSNPPSGAHAGRIAELEKERDDAVALGQRATADYQNLRRRLSSDIDAAVARAKKPLHQELLLVLDYLDMALATPCATPEATTLRAGVEMTRTQLWTVLERDGLQAVPERKTFDPALHQAVERVETNDAPSGTILATLRRGYTAGGQILRPAQVKVAVTPNSDAKAGEAGGAS